MCIIALKPEKVLLTKSQLKIMWDSNPHGAGFMYAEGGEVKIVKGLTTLDALDKAINAVGPLRKLVIHFRIRTHGATSEEMTHPFWVREKKLAMVHNGVIRPLVHLAQEEESDTAVFARKLSENYSDPLVAVKNSFHRDMLETYIGTSKMVFMDNKGRTYILNEHLGEWSQNVWYSNTKYKVAPTVIRNTIPEPTRISMFDDRFRGWEKHSTLAPAKSSVKAGTNEFPGHFTSAPKAVMTSKPTVESKPPTRKEVRAAKAAEKAAIAAAEKLAQETKLVPKSEPDLFAEPEEERHFESRIPPLTN